MNNTRNAIKMASILVLSFFISSEIWDAFIQRIFVPSRQLTNLAAFISTMIESNYREFETGFLVAYLLAVSIAIAVVAWILHRFGNENHFTAGAAYRWALLGVVAGMQQFSELVNGIDILLAALVISLYWLMFRIRPPNKETAQM